MTKITIYLSPEGGYLGFDCTGHAGYADAGEDIVCAGISALVTNTVNSMEVYTEEPFSLDDDEEHGDIRLRFTKPPVGHDADLLMKSLVLGLWEIFYSYGNDYIQIKEVTKPC